MTASPRPILLAALALIASVVLVGLRESHPPTSGYASTAPIVLIPTLTGQPEYCLTCHNGIEEISAAHPTEVFGCVRCHGGQPLALDADTAHAGLLGGRNPSAFDVVEAGCGGADCHSGPAEDGLDHIHRSMVSLQSTYAGAIAVVREAFGSQSDAEAHFGIVPVTDSDVSSSSGLPSLEGFLPLAASEPPQVRAFANRCLTCHLRAEPIDEPGFQRLTGCAACHSLTNWQGSYSGADPTVRRDESGHAASHRLTTSIPFTQCNTCHNRGNYSLVDMSFHERADLASDGQASRLVAYYQPIAQFTSCEQKLDCIDCHSAGEVMGDGDLHREMNQVRDVACRTCHGTATEAPTTRKITDASDPALRQAQLNPFATLALGDSVVTTERGETLWNVRARSDGSLELMSKVTGTTYDVPPVAGSACEQNPEEQDSSACHACHAVERP
jgi:hypothetical protein